MWLIQIHDKKADGLDLIKLYTDYDKAFHDYKKIVKNNLDFLDLDFYLEADEDFKIEDLKITVGMIYLQDGNYMSLIEIEPNGDYVRSRQ